MNSKCQVSLIDTQFNPVRDMKFILFIKIILQNSSSDLYTVKELMKWHIFWTFSQLWGTKHSPLQQWERILQPNHKEFM
jgi:hypothetical protein